MDKLTYQQKLKDPRWQKKRLRILNRDNFTCQHCQADDKTLHVHHKYYMNVEPWEYEDNALITLCFECHEIEGIALDTAVTDIITMLKQKGLMAADFNALCTAMVLMDNSLFNESDVIKIGVYVMQNSKVQRGIFNKMNDGK